MKFKYMKKIKDILGGWYVDCLIDETRRTKIFRLYDVKQKTWYENNFDINELYYYDDVLDQYIKYY
jgi:hypothetical protein